MSGTATSPAALRRQVAARLAAAGLDEAALEARILVRHVAGIDPALAGAAAEAPLDPCLCEALEALVCRRLAREPIARLLGHREFHGHDFALNDACLVPRPDTETVVELALALLPADRPARLLDLGTGPGTILVSILAERPLAFGIGLDRSAEALRCAAANARRLGCAGRAGFLAGDWTAALAGRFDLVVSNPPYIATAACAGLDPEVSGHDPRLALDGGPDGLDAYRAILADAPRLLAPGGRVVLELGIGQAAPVAALGRRHGLAIAALRSDLAGVPRALALAPPV